MEFETDRSLQARMVGTVVLIAVLPLGFTVTMTWALNTVVRPLAEAVTETTIPAVTVDPLIVLALTLIGLVVAYVRGGRMAMRSVGARRVTEEQAPGLHARADRLAATAGVPAPDVAVVAFGGTNELPRPPEQGLGIEGYAETGITAWYAGDVVGHW